MKKHFAGARGGNAAGNENSRIGQRLSGRFPRTHGKLSVQNYVCATYAGERFSSRNRATICIGRKSIVMNNAGNRGVL